MTKKKRDKTRLALKKRSVRKIGDRHLEDAKGGAQFITVTCADSAEDPFYTENSCASSVKRQTGAYSSPQAY